MRRYCLTPEEHRIVSCVADDTEGRIAVMRMRSSCATFLSGQQGRTNDVDGCQFCGCPLRRRRCRYHT
jgi:hypothetical protein